MSNSRPLAELAALPVFPFADEFPYISDEETLELAQDIEANGLHHPVVLFDAADPETGEVTTTILDGRNRLAAIGRTKLTEVPVTVYDGDDPVGYVVSLNLSRRHLTTGQRAALAVLALPYFEEKAKERMIAAHASPGEFTGATGEARELVADKFTVGTQAVSRAKALAANADDLFAEMRAGLRTVNDAYSELKRRQDNSPLATPGDKAKPENPALRFESRVDRAVSALSDAIADHAEYGLADDVRYVRSALENLIRQAEHTFTR